MDLFNPLLVKKLEEILKKDPSSRSFCSLAQIYFSQSEFEKAEKVCLEGLVYHPSYSQAYVILGEIYKARGDVEKAIQVLNKAKEFNPDNPNIYKSLAEIYRKQKDLEKTLNAYKMLSFLKPEDKTARISIPHLEKVLNLQLVQKGSGGSGEAVSEKQTTASYENLSLKERGKLLKLKQILARVENYIKRESKEAPADPV